MLKRKLKKIATISLAILSMLAATAFSVPAVAGPDWAVIQDAREMSASQKVIKKQTLEKEMVLIDHGPRALSTPWQNKQHAQDSLSQFNKVGATSK